MKAAVIQVRGDQGLAGNLASVAHWLEQAAAAGAALAALPEAFAYYGYRAGGDSAGEHNLTTAGAAEATPAGPVRSFLAEQARRHGLWLLGGTLPVADVDVESNDARPFAASLLFSPAGDEIARYNKIHLFDVDVPETGKSYRESADYRPGKEVVTADTPLGRLGLSVCYDLRFPELYRALVDDGAEILAAPSAFTASTGRAHWELLLRARAVENLCYVLAPNMGHRDHPTRPTWGGSAIVDPWGVVLANLDDGEGFAIADIDLAHLRSLRARMPVHRHRRLGMTRNT
ncbi:MAG: carbon-nitrogen hydrolase family protein [Porticoccaceae bacterium]|nr:carbon-nitrogen hydrolase family protein [Porticoccaceae bacterium]